MPSEGRTARESQRHFYETAISRRLAVLREKGLEEAITQKDRYLRHLKAELRRTNSRLFRISQIEKQNEDLALRKEQFQGGKQPPFSPDPEKN